MTSQGKSDAGRVSQVAVEFPWPEDEDRVRARIRALVESVVQPHELEDVRLEWVTPRAHQWDSPDAGWVALRVTVSAIGDEYYAQEIWGPDWYCSWDHELWELGNDLEDWVCETRFAWGQQRHAVVPD